MARRTGLFGGSFNPPHMGHLIVAESVRDQFDLDRVVWIPNYIAPHKPDHERADAAHRLRMTKLSIASNPAFEASSLEIDRGGTSYTVDTVYRIVEEYPSDSVHLIVGGDSLRDFLTWRRPEEIIDQTPLIVYRRPNSGEGPTEAESRYPGRISFASAPMVSISSAAIRQRIREGRSIRYLVPEPVWSYIDQHALYT